MTPQFECTDKDGNRIRRGMLVRCCGDSWVVGYADNSLTRLDRADPTGRYCQSMILGRKRFCLIHIIGFQYPLIIQ